MVIAHSIKPHCYCFCRNKDGCCKLQKKKLEAKTNRAFPSSSFEKTIETNCNFRENCRIGTDGCYILWIMDLFPTCNMRMF